MSELIDISGLLASPASNLEYMRQKTPGREPLHHFLRPKTPSQSYVFSPPFGVLCLWYISIKCPEISFILSRRNGERNSYSIVLKVEVRQPRILTNVKILLSIWGLCTFSGTLNQIAQINMIKLFLFPTCDIDPFYHRGRKEKHLPNFSHNKSTLS